MSAEQRKYSPEQIVAMFTPSEPPANIDDFGPVKYIGHFKPFSTEVPYHRKNDNSNQHSKTSTQASAAHSKISPPKEVPNHPQILLKGSQQRSTELLTEEESSDSKSTSDTQESEKEEIKTFSFDSVINETEEEVPVKPDIQETPSYTPQYNTNQNLFPTNAQRQVPPQQLQFQQQFYQNGMFEQNRMPMFPTKNMQAELKQQQAEANKNPQIPSPTSFSAPQSPSVPMVSPFNMSFPMPNPYMQAQGQQPPGFNMSQMQAQLQFMQFLQMQMQMTGQLPQFNMFNQMMAQNRMQPSSARGPMTPNVFFNPQQQPMNVTQQQPSQVRAPQDTVNPVDSDLTIKSNDKSETDNSQRKQTQTTELTSTGGSPNKALSTSGSDKQRSAATKDRRFAPYVPGTTEPSSKVASLNTMSRKSNV